jgi:hypothetical protein
MRSMAGPIVAHPRPYLVTLADGRTYFWCACDGPRCWLNGRCYLATAELGARYQMQLLLEVEGGSSPVRSLGDRHLILFVVDGNGRACIPGRELEIEVNDGVYVLCVDGGSQVAAAGGRGDPPAAKAIAFSGGDLPGRHVRSRCDLTRRQPEYQLLRLASDSACSSTLRTHRRPVGLRDPHAPLEGAAVPHRLHGPAPVLRGEDERKA